MGSIFMHADGVDKCLMGLGFFGAAADCFSTPLLLYVNSRLMNDIGSASSLDPAMFPHKINKNALVLLYMACGLEFACFLVAFPFALFLIIPGMIYGRTLIIIARKMREEYNKAGTIAEQAVSSIRTVFAFVGESKMLPEFPKALEGSVKLGLRQRLATGLAIGSNGIVFIKAERFTLSALASALAECKWRAAFF